MEMSQPVSRTVRFNHTDQLVNQADLARAKAIQVGQPGHEANLQTTISSSILEVSQFT